MYSAWQVVVRSDMYFFVVEIEWSESSEVKDVGGGKRIF